jgi:type I restriction enzyme R subunit
MNEATARIKINRLLEKAGWRFFPEGGKPANVQLEAGVALKSSDLDGLGDDFEKSDKGFVDYLLYSGSKGRFRRLSRECGGVTHQWLQASRQ